MKVCNEITAAEFKAKRKGKPRFQRSKPEDRTFEGHTFDSKLDMERYRELRLRQQVGTVGWISIYPRFLLAGVVYTADFMYLNWLQPRVWFNIVVEEVKPLIRNRKARREALRAWRRNAAQMKELHGIDVVLVER